MDGKEAVEEWLQDISSICDKMRVMSDTAMKIASDERRRQKSPTVDLGACIGRWLSESQITFPCYRAQMRLFVVGQADRLRSQKRSEFSGRKTCLTKRLAILDKPSGPWQHSVV